MKVYVYEDANKMCLLFRSWFGTHTSKPNVLKNLLLLAVEQCVTSLHTNYASLKEPRRKSKIKSSVNSDVQPIYTCTLPTTTRNNKSRDKDKQAARTQ